MQLPAAKLILAVSEAIKVCEERAGRLAQISRETVPVCNLQDKTFDDVDADGVHGQNHGLRRLTEYFVGVTTYLAGYSECE